MGCQGHSKLALFPHPNPPPLPRVFYEGYKQQQQQQNHTQHIPTTEDFQDILILTSLGPDNISFDLTRTTSHSFQTSSSLELSGQSPAYQFLTLHLSRPSPSQIMTPSFTQAGVHHPQLICVLYPHLQILVFAKGVLYFPGTLLAQQYQVTFLISAWTSSPSLQVKSLCSNQKCHLEGGREAENGGKYLSKN